MVLCTHCECELGGALELVHPCLEQGGVPARQVEEQALEVGRDGDVHRRGQRLLDVLLPVLHAARARGGGTGESCERRRRAERVDDDVHMEC